MHWRASSSSQCLRVSVVHLFPGVFAPWRFTFDRAGFVGTKGRDVTTRTSVLTLRCGTSDYRSITQRVTGWWKFSVPGTVMYVLT